MGDRFHVIFFQKYYDNFKVRGYIEMKKIYFLNKLNISLLFLIIFFFLANSINAQTFFNPNIGYGYSGYPEYGYPKSSYSAYPYAYPYIGDGNYSRYVSLGGSLVPREIFELSASSNWDTAQLGQALIKPYFQTSVMSDWTPWGSLPYYNRYPSSSGYQFFPSTTYYSYPNSPFSFSVPSFSSTSYWPSWPGYYPTTSYSNSKTNNSGINTVTITGTVVGDHSISSNGRVINCYVHQMQQAVYNPLDLSPYIGKVVEVNGDLRNDDLYSAIFERVVY